MIARRPERHARTHAPGGAILGVVEVRSIAEAGAAMARERESSDDPQLAGVAGPDGMRERVRAFDWSRTALGPMDRWPHPLKTAVQIALDSAFPTCVWWGPELIQLYNDAASLLLGALHPAALGQPARKCWGSLWAKVEPMLESVLATGESASGTMEATCDRRDAPRPSWFEFCFAALRDESGAVGGVFITAIEITELVLAERKLSASEDRQRFLLKLSDALRPLTDPAGIQGEAARQLREQFGVGWCYYIEFNEALTEGVVHRDAVRPGLASLAGIHDVSDAPDFLEFLHSVHTLNVPDFPKGPLGNRRIADRYGALGVKSLLGAPLVKGGRVIGVLLMRSEEHTSELQSPVHL